MVKVGLGICGVSFVAVMAYACYLQAQIFGLL
jgi:hypothetical protein